jgi:hypothetical protein
MEDNYVTQLSLAFLENAEMMQFSPASLVLFTTTTKPILNKTTHIRIMEHLRHVRIPIGAVEKQ